MVETKVNNQNTTNTIGVAATTTKTLPPFINNKNKYDPISVDCKNTILLSENKNLSSDTSLSSYFDHIYKFNIFIK